MSSFFLGLSLRAAADGFAAFAHGRLRDAGEYFEASALLATCAAAARLNERAGGPLLVPPSAEGGE